ncbi:MULTISPECIES: GntR family transcriptional regulator [unclassified Lysinibacillus]|uniref:GntR family transcriptional regulator n=1 Tax=unclassified Lysinibacillus TaxID=2636778 RepID=UPI0025534000|nr:MULTISPECIES: GntR family transcriptional regulator [unclassified Lysinibacillus]MDM5251000.1 GntR family transcriptional regulator [Lysinibacillus sp. G4S2]
MKEKERSSDKIENELIRSILTGVYSVGSTLPPERELAKKFGVGRPTIREALQRLGRGGWITGRKGMPAIVNDYWRNGNLSTLVNIVENHHTITDEFIMYLLELRSSLTPTYIRDAVTFNQPKVVALLANLEQLKDSPESYAAFDWELQKKCAGLAVNPIYLLILNSFDSIYLDMAKRFFSVQDHRGLSFNYYHDLLKAALKGDAMEAERLSKTTMEKSLALWRDRKK